MRAPNIALQSSMMTNSAGWLHPVLSRFRSRPSHQMMGAWVQYQHGLGGQAILPTSPRIGFTGPSLSWEIASFLRARRTGSLPKSLLCVEMILWIT